jgi:hypothetical protein
MDVWTIGIVVSGAFGAAGATLLFGYLRFLEISNREITPSGSHHR